jgi:signal peptidase II
LKPHTRDFAIAGGWLVFDQVTKLLASGTLQDGYVLVVPHFLRFSLSHNPGALFGMMGTMADPWRGIILTALPIVAIGAIIAFILRTPSRETFARLGFALILGGALGNVIDRVLYGHVVDFILVYGGWEPVRSQLVAWFGTNQWPTFNVADIGLVCGAGLLMVEIFVRRAPAEEPAEEAEEAEEKDAERAPVSD